MGKSIIALIITFVYLTPPQQSRIQKIIQEENKRQGTMVDNLTRFERAGIIENISGQNDVFFYNHTYLGDCSEFDPDLNKDKLKALYFIIEASIAHELSMQIKGQKRFIDIGKLGYDIYFYYECQNGLVLSSIKFELIGNQLVYKENSDQDIVERIDHNLLKKRLKQFVRQ